MRTGLWADNMKTKGQSTMMKFIIGIILAVIVVIAFARLMWSLDVEKEAPGSAHDECFELTSTETSCNEFCNQRNSSWTCSTGCGFGAQDAQAVVHGKGGCEGATALLLYEDNACTQRLEEKNMRKSVKCCCESE